MWTHAASKWTTFPTKEAKADYLQRSAEASAHHPAIRALAARFLALPEAERAAAILRFCQASIRYERDPGVVVHGHRYGVEVLDSPEIVLRRGYGDCDAKAVIFCALALACGLRARTSPVFRGESFPHIRDEVAGPGGWLVADPSIVNSTIGHLPRRPLTNWD